LQRWLERVITLMEHLFDGWMVYFCATSNVEVSIWRWCVCVLNHESMKWISKGPQTIW
jgi:hypothetical protein